MPKIDRADPNLAKDLKDSELPKCKKSTTDIEAPSRTMLRTDKEEPM
jgi:hypothetical protein